MNTTKDLTDRRFQQIKERLQRGNDRQACCLLPDPCALSDDHREQLQDLARENKCDFMLKRLTDSVVAT